MGAENPVALFGRGAHTMYLSGSDPVAVSKHARTLEQLARSAEEILARTGKAEDEIARLFDLRRVLPG